MAEGGIEGILSKETAGLPNWAWLLIVAAGLAAAYIVPKFLGGGKTGNASTSGSDTSTGDTSGIGLAIDPTTGLPYAVEGLVPSGAGAGGGSTSTSGSTSGSSSGSTSGSSSGSNHGSGSGSTSGSAGEKWYTIPKWPNGDEGSFSQLASKVGVSATRLEQLNPQINKNAKLQSGWKIRIA